VLAVVYSTVVSANRPPVPTAVAPELAEPPPPPRIEGLRPLEPPGRWIEAAMTQRGGPRPLGVASVEVTGGPRAGGLAVLDGESLAQLAWVDLSAGEPLERLDLPGIPIGDHWLVAARSAATARFSYVSRTRLAMEAEGGEVHGSASIDVTRHRFLLDLCWPDLEGPAPPLAGISLRRVDDPAWRYRPPSSLRDDPDRADDGHRVFELTGLGAGAYEVTVEGAVPVPADAPRLRVTLPGPAAIEIRCENP